MRRGSLKTSEARFAEAAKVAVTHSGMVAQSPTILTTWPFFSLCISAAGETDCASMQVRDTWNKNSTTADIQLPIFEERESSDQHIRSDTVHSLTARLSN